MPNLPEQSGAVEKRSTLSIEERLALKSAKMHEHEKLNGGCSISADVEETLKRLTAGIRPPKENLAKLIRRKVEKFDAQHRRLEEIWAEKIAQGANYVGVIEGTFHFFQNNQILPEDNIALAIPVVAPDSILGLRSEERKKDLATFEAKKAAMDLPWNRPDEDELVDDGDDQLEAEIITPPPVNNPIGTTMDSGMAGSLPDINNK